MRPAPAGPAARAAINEAAASPQHLRLPDGLAGRTDRHEALNLSFTVNQSIRNSASVWIIVAFIALAAYPVFGAWHVGAWVVLVGGAAALRTRLLRPATELDTV